MQLSHCVLLALALGVALVGARPLQIVGYQYVPDLNGDGLVGLKAYIENAFHTAYPAYSVNLTYDTTDYALDSYTPSSIIDALTVGGYDMFEIDTIMLGLLLQTPNLISKIPSGVDFTGYLNGAKNMVKGFPKPNGQQDLYGVPSYACTNVYYSYDSALGDANCVDDVIEFIHHRRTPHGTAKVGWASDLSSSLNVRLEYLDSWLDSHSSSNFYPVGYSSVLDPDDVSNVKRLRNTCTDKSVHPHINHCADGAYYHDPTSWFSEFSSGKSLILQGFPEYFSEILASDNANVNAPTHVPGTFSAITGNGDQPYMFADAFVMSKQNCRVALEDDGFDCQAAATAWLNWSKTNYARIASLGLDLSPVRPRFLAVAYEPFWTSSAVTSLPAFAKNHYNFEYSEVSRAKPLDTLHFMQNNDDQSTKLYNKIIANFDP